MRRNGSRKHHDTIFPSVSGKACIFLHPSFSCKVSHSSRIPNPRPILRDFLYLYPEAMKTVLFFHCSRFRIPASSCLQFPAYDTHDIWKKGSLVSWCSKCVCGPRRRIIHFLVPRNEPSPREWKFSPLWSETEKEQILMVADYMERHGPERFLLRSLSPNSRHIDWHLFSEFSMSQYMKDEIRERLQMIRETAENGDGRCPVPPIMNPCCTWLPGWGTSSF